ncbi:MAG TPA: dephospho-CoA kinase [Steroidobacteraceae bacterium]|nr:dephospho-CoA kinase [Steroidobacteraceae bacterium]HQW08781.1 dephospho-CoA kinase [Steroidobacteraceae bacterium]HQX46084.1 dephospho-CoA kinase [Steroidobacteraceae bacterium]HQX78776.1 dephospho-CoA kinase [Steroidobacteraceae bacterium]HQZ80505.1 dephospho-CoA kinase [Steroidobacteraceae bacterium]
MTPVFRVGLTGGIASGKSTVANLFAALGVPVIDSDVIARDVVAPGSALLERIRAEFGGGVLAPDGSLDRKALRARVFGETADSTAARRRLEALTHPAIRAEMDARSAKAGGPYQILAIPLLVEGGARGRVDRVLVVDADEATQIRRLQARDGSTLAEARAILAAQTDRARRRAAADDIITNNGDLAALAAQVEGLHAAYLAAAGVYGSGGCRAQ